MLNVEDVREWMRFARMDLSSAEYLRGHSPIPIEIICYLCRQATEKAIKAVLIKHDAVVPRIHNLKKLLLAAEQYENSMQSLSQQANWLTDFATFTRYPNEINISEADMKTALKYAEDILTQVELLLSELLEEERS